MYKEYEQLLFKQVNNFLQNWARAKLGHPVYRTIYYYIRTENDIV